MDISVYMSFGLFSKNRIRSFCSQTMNVKCSSAYLGVQNKWSEDWKWSFKKCCMENGLNLDTCGVGMP